MTLGLAEMVAVRLGRLPIELVMLPPHPAARHPATTMATNGEILFAGCRMLCTGGCTGPGASDSRTCPALPPWDSVVMLLTPLPL